MNKYILASIVAALAVPFGAVAANTPSTTKRSPAFVCVETTTNTGVVPANSSIAIEAPACPASYTITSGGCGSSNPPLLFISEIDTNSNGFGCEFVSSSPQQETVWAYGRCCKVQ